MPDDHVTTDDLLNRIEEIEAALDDLGSDYDDLCSIVDHLKQDVAALPNGAKTGNVDEILSVGDRYEIVVEDDGSGTDKGDPMGRVEGGIVVFLQNVDDRSITPGDVVEAVISKTGETHAKAVIPEDDVTEQDGEPGSGGSADA